MSMNLGENAINDIFIGQNKVNVIYLGNDEVWSRNTPPATSYWGLCFTAVEQSTTVQMIKYSTPSITPTLLYSTDGSTWNDFTPGTTVITLSNAGDKVWLKAGPGGNSKINGTDRSYWKFSFNKNIAASGNIMSLLDGETPTYSLQAYAFCHMFNGSTLVSIPDLPATSTANNSYHSTFEANQSLTSFYWPTDVSSYGGSACQGMFINCKSLLSCYIGQTSPVQSTAYRWLVSGCSALADVTIGLSAWPNTKWIDGVSSTGSFYCPRQLGTNSTITRGDNYCPANWDVTNIAYFTYNDAQARIHRLNGQIATQTIQNAVDEDGRMLNQLAYVDVGDEATSISQSAFYGQSSIEQIKVGTNVQTIGSNAFGDMASLLSVVFYGKQMSEVQEMENYPWGADGMIYVA